MSNLQKALEYAHQNRERFLSELIEILNPIHFYGRRIQ